MVMKKRLDTRATGFQIPIVPRAPRSARRRGLLRKISDANDICAIELLASLAGKLLQESESSSASNNSSEETNQLSISKDAIKQERQDEDKPLKRECFEQSSCNPCREEALFHSEQASEDGSSKCSSGPFPKTEGDSTDPIVTGTAFSGEIKSPVCKEKKEVGISCKIMGKSPGMVVPSDVKLDSQKEQHLDRHRTGGITCPKDPMEYHIKVPANSTGLMQKPLLKDLHPVATFSKRRNDTKLGRRDGDENFPRFNKCSNKMKPFRHPQRIADRRIRKLLTSKYWRATPKLKDCELSKAEGGLKAFNQKRKDCYSGERYHNDRFYKRRKLLNRSSIATSDGVLSSESVSNSPQKGMIGAKNDIYTSVLGESRVSSSVFGGQSSFQAKDAHVKFSIQSFRIPELYIDVPETATVGLLKRTVMEAVNAILGKGLRVGVVLRGKKVRDDNRTLLQTGISCKENLDELGFTLEPSQPRTPPVISAEVPLPLTCDTPSIIRAPDNPASDPVTVEATSNPLPLTSIANTVDNNQQTISSQSDVLSDKTVSESKALVAVPAPEMHPEPLAIVPVNPKTKRSELSQRRIRRPFSVTEVEALVRAVEELGTGRWRDVKLRAFENADHRTYVDLKDKWKTLVHTASISPQQRRGEPVPQELLDRVLAAHAYWSQHQAKQHGKNHAVTPKIADVQAERSQVEAV